MFNVHPIVNIGVRNIYTLRIRNLQGIRIILLLLVNDDIGVSDPSDATPLTDAEKRASALR